MTGVIERVEPKAYYYSTRCFIVREPKVGGTMLFTVIGGNGEDFGETTRTSTVQSIAPTPDGWEVKTLNSRYKFTRTLEEVQVPGTT